jgi:hypothetical protein
MDVVPLGRLPDGPDLFMDAYAAAARAGHRCRNRVPLFASF